MNELRKQGKLRELLESDGEPMPPPGSEPEPPPEPKRSGPWAHLPLEPHPDLGGGDGASPRGARLPFPIAALPGPVADLVAALSTFAQTPPDLPGCFALGILSIAVAGKARALVKGNYSEGLNLFVVPLLGPGNKKSPVFRQLFKPVKQYERHLVKQTRAARAVAQAERRQLEEDAAQLRKRLRGTQGPDRADLDQSIADLASRLEALPSDAEPRLYLQDATPEVLAKVLEAQKGRIAIADAEGVFFNNLSRYSDEPNYDNVLKGQAGDEIRVSRMNGTELRIDRPCIALAVAAQPNVLVSLGQKPGAMERGLIDRMLVSRPASNIGYRDADPPEVPPHLWTRWAEPMRRLLALAPPKAEPQDDDDGAPGRKPDTGRDYGPMVGLSPGARAVRLEFVRAVEEMMRPGKPLAHMHGWGCKIQGTVVGIAGVLHFAEAACVGTDEAMRDVWHRPISEAEMLCAVELAWYFLDHARAVYDEILLTPEEMGNADRAADVLVAIEVVDEHCFKGRGVTTAELAAALCPNTREQPPPGPALLRSALLAFAGAKAPDTVDALKLGKKLSALTKAGALRGRRLESAGAHRKVARWRVVRVDPRAEGCPGSPPNPTPPVGNADFGSEADGGGVGGVGGVPGKETDDGAEGRSAA